MSTPPSPDSRDYTPPYSPTTHPASSSIMASFERSMHDDMMNDNDVNDNMFGQYDGMSNMTHNNHATIEEITDDEAAAQQSSQLTEEQLLADDDDAYDVRGADDEEVDEESDSDDELYEPESYINYLTNRLSNTFTDLQYAPKQLQYYSWKALSLTGTIAWSLGTTAVFFGVPYVCAIQLEQMQALNNECLARYQQQVQAGQSNSQQQQAYNPYAPMQQTGSGIPAQ